MKRLVIIGNGFDLAHNLPTKFVNFIDSDPEYIKKYNLFKGNDWNNIEENYKNILTEEISGRPYVNIAEELEGIISTYGYNKYGEIDYIHNQSNVYSEEMNYISSCVELLTEFEIDFLEYLKIYCNVNMAYIRPRNKIVSILKNTSWVINFNYTNLIQEVYHYENVTHIHGSIYDNNIAIGTGALDDLKKTLVDSIYPTEIPCNNKYDFQEKMLYYEEDMDGNLLENERIHKLFNQLNQSIRENEYKLFEFLDEKSKEKLQTRIEVKERLSVERFDEVYILGHSLGEADYSIFQGINKDALIICYFYDLISEDEYIRMEETLKSLGNSFKLIPNIDLYQY